MSFYVKIYSVVATILDFKSAPKTQFLWKTNRGIFKQSFASNVQKKGPGGSMI